MTYTPIFSLTEAIASAKELLMAFPEVPLIVSLAVGFGLAAWILKLVRGRKK